jgi:hypothetical protein
MTDLRKWTIVWTISLVILATGIALIVSPIDKITTYKASGELLQTPSQWETTKVVLAENKVELGQITVLDHGSTLLVQFTGLTVHKDFPYGSITTVIGKGSTGSTLEHLFTVLGVVATFITTLGVCSEKWHWGE